MSPSQLSTSFYKPLKTLDIGKPSLHSRRHVAATQGSWVFGTNGTVHRRKLSSFLDSSNNDERRQLHRDADLSGQTGSSVVPLNYSRLTSTSMSRRRSTSFPLGSGTVAWPFSKFTRRNPTPGSGEKAYISSAHGTSGPAHT
jgi:hypothetical protein